MREPAMDPALALRLQRYAWAAAAASYRAVSCPPFTAFFSLHDPAPHRNYAVPQRPEPPTAAAIDRVTALYRARGLRPRFELIPDANPGLLEALEACGYPLEERTVMMVCDASSVVPAVERAELEVVVLDATASARNVADALRVQACAFGGLEALPPRSMAAARAERAALGDARLVLGRRGRVPVCAAGIMPVRDGIAELTGVATVPWERGRGLGTTVASVALAMALRGASLCSLTAADAAAGRLYARLGFRAVGEACACSRP